MNEFIITFRECLEATLIVGIVYTFLIKTNMHSQLKYLWSAVASSIIASIGVAFLLASIKSNIGNSSMEKLVEAIFMYTTAGLLLYVVFWLSKSVSNRQALEKLAKNASNSSKWGIFLLIFFAILREGFETVMFLMGGVIQTGSFSYTRFILGIILACLIGYMIFSQSKNINLKPFFAITTFFLILFAAGMNAYGTHEMEEYLVKTNKIQEIDIKRPWDILQPTIEYTTTTNTETGEIIKEKYTQYHILHDKGTVGSFLKGLLGYNSNPNWVELIFWILTIVFGLNIWRKFYIKS